MGTYKMLSVVMAKLNRSLHLLILELLSLCLGLPDDVVTKLVIDHDGGGDDAAAIFLALSYEKYFHGPKLIAITTTHGNVQEPQAFLNTQRILHIAGRQDIPVYRGANLSLVETRTSDHFFGLDGLGDTGFDYSSITVVPAQEMHAALALIDYSKQYEGRLDVIAVGVLTNIALAVRLDPLFLKRLHHLYIGAGTIHSQNDPIVEFNAIGDVEAYRAVTDSSTPDKVTIMPISSIRDVNTSVSWRKDVLGAIPSKIMQALNKYEQVSFVKTKAKWGWGALDAATMSVVLNPSIVKSEIFVKNSIIKCGPQRGFNSNEIVDASGANVKMIYALNNESYRLFLVTTFSAGADVQN